MTEELEDGKHSNTSVLKLGSLTLSKDVIGKVDNSSWGGEPSVSLNTSNEGNDLSPSEEGDSRYGSKTVGDIRGADFTRNQVVSESVGLWGNVSKNSHLGNTSVLKLGEAVFVELLLGDTIGEASGVPESNRGEGTDLVLEGSKRRGGLSNLSGGKGGSGGESRCKDDGLHGCSSCWTYCGSVGKRAALGSAVCE